MWKKRNPACNTVADVVLANNPEYKTIDEFLAPPDTTYVTNMDKVADRIKAAIKSNEHITVFGDYDADGITSTAEFKEIFSAFKYENYTIRHPERMAEGYGMSETVVDEFESGLLITVDNGISAYKAIEKAKDKGLFVIVIDHHPMNDGGVLPPADILVDPNAIPGSSFSGFCGAGLVYVLAEKLLKNHVKALTRIRCLATIGTVADVVPLKRDNWQIVHDGIKDITTFNGRSTGLKALMQSYGCDELCTVKDLSFSVIPAINAWGRLDNTGAKKAYDMITYDGPMCAAIAMAEVMHGVNDKRKEIVTEDMDKVHENMRIHSLYGDSPMVVYEPGIPEGVVGIIAGRIAGELDVPAFVFTDSSEPGLLKGSARTARDINLKTLMDANAGLLHTYGGHPKAAGITIEKDKLGEVREAFNKTLADNNGGSGFEDYYYDLEITPSQIPQMMAELERFAPYGEGNPPLIFKVTDYELKPSYKGYYTLMGASRNHVKFWNSMASAIGFDMASKYISLGNFVRTTERGISEGDLPESMSAYTKTDDGKNIKLTDLPRRLDMLGELTLSHYKDRRNGAQHISNQIELVDFLPKTSAQNETPLAKILRQQAEAQA